uniref:RGS domain-containing protein n=1 Tax=Panagrellus redivivus TaxID=6233 RepID=A0A7E4ZX84_PANRE
MKITVFFVCILSILPIAHAFVGTIVHVAELVLAATEFGITIYDVFWLRKEDKSDENAEFITGVLSGIGENLQLGQVNFEKRLDSLHSTLNMQYYDENVGFPAHTTFIIAEKYLQQHSNFIKDVFLNECLRHPPFAVLTYLDSMLSENWFVTQSQLHNCRFRDVEALRIRLLRTVEQSIISHYICMTVQAEFNESQPLTKLVFSTAENITRTLERQVDVIEETYFPHCVAKEVISVAASMSHPESVKERNLQIANSVSFMLTQSYGHGIFAISTDRQFENYEYSVYVGDSSVEGLLPEKSILKVDFSDYFIFIYRSNVSNTYLPPPEVFFNTLITNVTCHDDLNQQLIHACTKFEFCGLTHYDKNGVTMGRNNVEQMADRICGEFRLLITGLPLGASPRVEKMEVASDTAENEFLASIRKMRVQVREKLIAVRDAKEKAAAKLAEEVANATALAFAEVSNSASSCVKTSICIAFGSLVVLWF